MTTSKYKLIEAYGAESLSEAVQELLDAGWELHGSPSIALVTQVTTTCPVVKYTQAVRRTDTVEHDNRQADPWCAPYTQIR